MHVSLLIAGLLVLHLDFNTIQMKKECVVDCLREAAKCGYNSVLWEVENKIRWETCPECVHPEAFTKDEFREILTEADRLGLEPIPLLQTFGHAEYVLSGSVYKSWREKSENPACYCASNPEVRAFLKRFLHEYLDLFGSKVRHFHLGGDEAIAFGTCPKCRIRNKMDLYVEHLGAIAKELVEKNIRPGVWADMMLIAGNWNCHDEITLNESETRKLPTSYTLWNWNYSYGYAPESTPRVGCANRMEFSGWLKGKGYSIVACGASQSGGDTVFLPAYERHRDNLAACAELARKNNLLGCCCTSWSVHLYPKSLQYLLWDFTARRYLDPADSGETDYAAAVRCQFNGLKPMTLNRISVGGELFRGFDARQREYLKPAIPAEPGCLAMCLKEAKKGGNEAVMRRVEALREEAAALDNGLGELRTLPNATFAIRTLIEAVELKKEFAMRVADLLEGRSCSSLPVEETRAFYELFQSPKSATNSVALAWSVLAQGLRNIESP